MCPCGGSRRLRSPGTSSEAIYKKFLAYLRQEDFVGADMARKFLQMGFTRARRYTNYKGGRKYDPKDKHLLEKGTGDPVKAESARIFYEAWQKAEAKPAYARMKSEWKEPATADRIRGGPMDHQPARNDPSPIALQLWTIRDAMAADADGALRRVKAAGFSAVELAPLPPGLTPARLAECLARHGLAVVSIHGDLPTPANIGHWAQLARACRCPKIIWHGWPRDPRFDSPRRRAGPGLRLQRGRGDRPGPRARVRDAQPLVGVRAGRGGPPDPPAPRVAAPRRLLAAGRVLGADGRGRPGGRARGTGAAGRVAPLEGRARPSTASR